MGFASLKLLQNDFNKLHNHDEFMILHHMRC